ncbi:MAG: hypothetical protein ACJ74D_06120 [Gaiellaceae bacterium]|jgi:hypothetical protein
MQHKHTVLLACACVLAALVCATALRAETTPPPGETTTSTVEEVTVPIVDILKVQSAIRKLQQKTWYWQGVMGARRTRSLAGVAPEPLQRLEAWRRLATRTWNHARNPPHKQQWLCIHRYEGAWRDPNPPYYGGLQMDVQFQRTYGGPIYRRKGTADHWTPLEQMWTAERAHRSGRGFYPWPNTARFCGLI